MDMDNNSSHFEFEAANNEQVRSTRVHYHGRFEVYYLCNGSCRYFIENKTYALTAGDLVVISPRSIHKVIYDTDIHSRLLFYCSADYIPTSVHKHIDTIAYFPCSVETQSYVESLFQCLKQTYEQPDEFAEDAVRCYVMQLFLTMAKNSVCKQHLATGHSFIESALAYIQCNYADKITLADTAKYCAVSAEHLSRIFKKETGFGFNEYLNIFRLKKAEALLKNGSVKNISHVASLCGFNDSNYFSSVYKKYYGIPPSKAKQQQEEKTYVF